jgi:protein-tyrosine phosphatase
MKHTYHKLVDTRYGTYRGLIRLWLAQSEALLGRLDGFREVELGRVERMVFVCLGNVCRSPYAALLSREHGLPTASFGLSTQTGIPAYTDAVASARRRGRDLTAHAATDLVDFEIRDTDLLLVMEVRQARALEKRLGESEAQIALLGFWAKPSRPHVHDPMTLSGDYFDTCYRVLESAVENLAADYRRMKAV